MNKNAGINTHYHFTFFPTNIAILIITIIITAYIAVFIRYPIKYPKLLIFRICGIFKTKAIPNEIKKSFLSDLDAGNIFIYYHILSLLSYNCFKSSWCPGEDLNLHILRYSLLKTARLPVPPPGLD